jgi:hypothetical protein
MTRVPSASRIRLSFISILAVALTSPASTATGQQPVTTTQTLTLLEAWAKAESKSDQLALAAARSDQARGNALETSSIRKPRLAAFSAYDRTLKSEFEGFGGFAADTTTSSDTESAEVPFGSAHTYRAGLTASYMVFSGGRSLILYMSMRRP